MQRSPRIQESGNKLLIKWPKTFIDSHQRGRTHSQEHRQGAPHHVSSQVLATRGHHCTPVPASARTSRRGGDAAGPLPRPGSPAGHSPRRRHGCRFLQNQTHDPAVVLLGLTREGDTGVHTGICTRFLQQLPKPERCPAVLPRGTGRRTGVCQAVCPRDKGSQKEAGPPCDSTRATPREAGSALGRGSAVARAGGAGRALGAAEPCDSAAKDTRRRTPHGWTVFDTGAGKSRGPQQSSREGLGEPSAHGCRPRGRAVAGALLAAFLERPVPPESPRPSCGPAWAQVMRRSRGSRPPPPSWAENICSSKR